MAEKWGRALPPPATQADEYACAQVCELRRLNANIEMLIALLTPPVDTDEGTVRLREPRGRRRG